MPKYFSPRLHNCFPHNLPIGLTKDKRVEEKEKTDLPFNFYIVTFNTVFTNPDIYIYTKPNVAISVGRIKELLKGGSGCTS